MENTTMGKQILFWAGLIAAIVLVVAGMIWLVSLQQKSPVSTELTIDNPITDEDWVLGNRDAKVVLTEYSDFQCPGCAQYFLILNQLVEDFGNQMAFVYRHFPLPSHVHSKSMVKAAEAAGKQGKFWEMHGLIFSSQSEWTVLPEVKNTVLEFAKTAGLDVGQFEKDFESDEMKDKVEAISAEARRIGLQYTPSFFLNGKLIQNPRSYDEFKKLIADAIEQNK